MTSIDSSNLQILIVDSDPVVLSVLNEQLQPEGFQVTTAANSEEGARAIASHSYSVVLASHELDGSSGLELLSKAKEANGATVRLLSSSRLGLGDLCEAVRAGTIDRFIVKPWMRDDLLAILRNSVALRLSGSPQTDTGSGQPEAGQPAVDAASAGTSGTESVAAAEGGDALVDVFVTMIGSFHPNLGSQSERAMALCETMGRNLNLSANQARSFRWAGGLHAIGLIHVERAVARRWLRSADKCTDEELNLIKRHPKEAVEMLKPWPIFQEAGEIVLGYRENWDGTGYPDRLKAEMIPTLSRLLAPAVYFACRHQPAQQIVKEMEKQVKVMFDPKAVEAVAKAAPETQMPRGVREILLIELEPGMVLAQDIRNSSGLLILAKDRELTSAWINKISNINNATPLKAHTMVYC